MDENNETQAWKQKYLNSLDELEAKERRWAENEQVLRHGLARLTLAADTSDYELNSLLENLRKLLRGDSDNLAVKALLERLVEPIRRLDEARKSNIGTPALNELLEVTLGRIVFPRGMGHRAKAMQKQLLQSPDTPQQELLDAFVLLISDAIQFQSDGTEIAKPDPDKRGLLGRILSRGSSQDTSTGNDVELVLARQLLEQMLERLAGQDVDHEALQERVRHAVHQAEILRLGRELAGLLSLGSAQTVVDGEELSSTELLMRLMERLEIPTELDSQADMIREMLDSPDVAEHMERVISAIADLVRDMRHRLMSEKNEIENFLSEVTEYLREIDEGFQENISGQRAAYEGGKRLNQQVFEQVSGIEASVNEAKDLEGVKSALATRIDTIRSHMNQFRQDQDQRLMSAETQVSVLNQRIQTMQQESEHLRRRIKEQRDLAMVDPLTGVPNRLAYNERMTIEYARWKRYGHELVLAVWDVDRFKSVNDTYGHQAGDKVLSVIAKLLQTTIRETDFVARFGGEEFLLLMPDTNLEGAAKVSDELRQAVEKCEFHFRGKRVPITISCGMSIFNEGDTPEQVFARADAALYRAKENGRNQCRSG